MMTKILLLIATFFKVGKFPKAPGTMGTLAAIPLWWGLAQLGPLPYMAITLLLIPVGIMASTAYIAYSNTHDCQEIVIDEVVGYLITMVWLPITWQSAVLGFIIFRILDITKPPPIRSIDRNVKGGFGVMADDIVAGIIGSIIMQLVYTQTNWLGVQITTLTAN